MIFSNKTINFKKNYYLTLIIYNVILLISCTNKTSSYAYKRRELIEKTEKHKNNKIRKIVKYRSNNAIKKNETGKYILDI